MFKRSLPRQLGMMQEEDTNKDRSFYYGIYIQNFKEVNLSCWICVGVKSEVNGILFLGFVMIAVFSFRSIVLSKTGRFPFVIVPVREIVRFGFSIVPGSGIYGPLEGPSPASVGIIEKSKSTDSFRLSICGVDCFPPNVDSNCFGITGRTGDALAALTRVGETECVLSLDILRCELARTGRVAICFGGEAGRVGEPPESYRFLLNGEGDRLDGEILRPRSLSS